MDWLDRVLISRHAVLKEYAYDDGGYCETKLKRGSPIYWAEVAGGNGELMCSECMLQELIQQLLATGTIPRYEDYWMEEWTIYQKKEIGDGR